MARETGNVVTQIGVEVTPGTGVSALRTFAGLMFDLGAQLRTKESRSNGYKTNTSSQIQQEWAAGTYTGPMSYVEICYVLAGLFPFTVTPTTVGAVTYYTWLFRPNARGQDLVKSFTTEQGDDEAAEQYVFTTLSSLNLNWTLDDATMNGNAFSRAVATLGSLSTPAVQLAQRQVSARDIDIFMADNYTDLVAGTGTYTKITDPYESALAMGDKFQPKWVLNTDYQSWKEAKEVVPDVTWNFLTEHNTQSRTLFNLLKPLTNPKKLFRVQATGPQIVASPLVNYRIRLNYSGMCTQKEKVRDADGIYAYRYGWTSMYDVDMDRSFEIEIINKLSGL
jgi:hypothetical protein